MINIDKTNIHDIHDIHDIQIHKSGWQLPPNKMSDTAEEYIDAFLESARFFEEMAKIRENCRNMKSA